MDKHTHTGHDHAGHGHGGHSHADDELPAEFAAQDPVCGMTVDTRTALAHEHEGQRYYFLFCALPRSVRGHARAISWRSPRRCRRRLR